MEGLHGPQQGRTFSVRPCVELETSHKPSHGSSVAAVRRRPVRGSARGIALRPGLRRRPPAPLEGKRRRHQPPRVGVCPCRASSGIAISARRPSERIDGPPRFRLRGRGPGRGFRSGRQSRASSRVGLGEERRVPNFEGQPNHGPSFSDNILEDTRCQLPTALSTWPARSGRAEGGLPAMPAATHGVSSTTLAPSPRPSSAYQGPIFGPNSGTIQGVGRGELGDCVDAEFGQPARHLGSDAPQVLGGPAAHDVEPVPGSETKTPPACRNRRRPWPGPGVADAHAAMQPRSLQDSGLHLPGVGPGPLSQCL